MDPIKIGRAIKALRTKAGLKQKDIAEVIHVTDKAVSRWERGIGVPDISIIHKLADYLNVDIDNLLEGNIAYLDTDWIGLLLLDEIELEVPLDILIYDKPLTDIWFSYFILAGIKHICIKANGKDGETLQSIYESGEIYGISISYISDLEELKAANYMLIKGSVFLYGANLTKAFQRAMTVVNKVTQLTIPKHSSEEGRVIVNARNLTSDANAWIQTHHSLPIYFIHGNEFQSVFTNNHLSIREESLNYQPLGKGMVECTLSTYDDVAEVSYFIRFMEHNTGFHIYSMAEVAWRRGLVSAEELLKNPRLELVKKQYLKSLLYETSEEDEHEKGI